MSQYNYKSKVFISATLLFILFGGIIYFVQRASEKEIKTKALEEYLEQATDCVNSYIIDYTTHPQKRQPDTLSSFSHLPDPQALGRFLAYLPNKLRFTIINLRGDVYFDNFTQGPIPENHLSRAELQQANLHGTGTSKRYSETLGEDFYYFAKEYQDQGYYIRVAIPYHIDYVNYFRSNHFFLLLIVGIFSLALLAVVFFTDQFSRSVRKLHDFVAKAQAGGEYESVTFPKSEIGELGEQLKKTFKMLEESKTRYEIEREKLIQHFASSDAGISFFSAERKFIYANSHFIQNLNTLVDTPTFIIDERILDYPELYQVKTLLAGIESDSDTAPRSTRYIIDRDGSHLEVRAQLFPDNSFEVVLTNVTKKENDRRLKHDMTNSIAHELRTPVTCARGYLETILNQPLPEEKQRYFIERTYNQMIRLSQLISDVSMITKLEEASDLYALQELTPYSVVEEVKAALEIKLQEAQMTICNRIPVQTTVQANHSLLYAVFANLTENSIRYAGTGTTIEIEQTMEDERYYYFTFADNGPGIPESESLAKIFDRFYRIDGGRSREMGGSGLGLSIVRNAIRFHGGEISAKNRPTGGLEFFFSLAKSAPDKTPREH